MYAELIEVDDVGLKAGFVDVAVDTEAVAAGAVLKESSVGCLGGEGGFDMGGEGYPEAANLFDGSRESNLRLRGFA